MTAGKGIIHSELPTKKMMEEGGHNAWFPDLG